MEKSIMAAFYLKIKEVIKNGDKDNWDKARDIEKLVETCELTRAILNDIKTEADGNYIKVVEEA